MKRSEGSKEWRREKRKEKGREWGWQEERS